MVGPLLGFSLAFELVVGIRSLRGSSVTMVIFWVKHFGFAGFGGYFGSWKGVGVFGDRCQR